MHSPSNKRTLAVPVRGSAAADRAARLEGDVFAANLPPAARGRSIQDDEESLCGVEVGGKRKRMGNVAGDDARKNTTVHRQQVEVCPSEGTLAPCYAHCLSLCPICAPSCASLHCLLVSPCVAQVQPICLKVYPTRSGG